MLVIVSYENLDIVSLCKATIFLFTFYNTKLTILTDVVSTTITNSLAHSLLLL